LNTVRASVSLLRWTVTEAAEGVRRRRVGLSPTEARPGGGPKFIRVDTEARIEIRETTPGAPTGAARRQAIFDHCTETDARWKSQDLGFGRCRHMHRTASSRPTEELSSVVSNASAEATRVTGATRHHCDAPATGICQPEPALNRCGLMRLTNFHFVQRACTPPHLSELRFGTEVGRPKAQTGNCLDASVAMTECTKLHSGSAVLTARGEVGHDRPPGTRKSK